MRATGVNVVEMQEYGYAVEVPEGYDEAVIRTRMALRGEGFGVLSEMHVGGMLGPEAGGERQYLIMGVWNSALQEKQLDAELKMAVHLPCNVVIQESGATAVVAALDPAEGLDEQQIAPQAADAARAALARVLQRVSVPA